MRLLLAFFRLVRWPNLVFIAITQLLFVYAIVHPILTSYQVVPIIKGIYFLLLIISSVLIAAGGYIINDYFDLNIDQINKPDKLVVEKIISRRWVIVWHLVLSFSGIVLGFVIDYFTRTRLVGLANIACVALLFIYSISLKKKLLSGNVLISLLTAWVILVVAWCELSNLLRSPDAESYPEKITRITFLYAGFAFIISLIREVVKDMEDIEGDRRYGARTMPIAWGLNVSKVFVAVWLVVLIAALAIVQVYVLQFQWWLSACYSIIFIMVPLLYVFRQLYRAKNAVDYHKLSSLIKLVMFTGILSMIFFRVYP